MDQFISEATRMVGVEVSTAAPTDAPYLLRLNEPGPKALFWSSAAVDIPDVGPAVLSGLTLNDFCAEFAHSLGLERLASISEASAVEYRLIGDTTFTLEALLNR